MLTCTTEEVHWLNVSAQVPQVLAEVYRKKATKTDKKINWTSWIYYNICIFPECPL